MPSGPAALRQGCALTLRHPYRRQSRWDCRLPDSMQAAGFFLSAACFRLFYGSSRRFPLPPLPVTTGVFVYSRLQKNPPGSIPSRSGRVFDSARSFYAILRSPFVESSRIHLLRSLSLHSGCFPGSSSFPQELLKPAFFGGTSGDGPESQGPLSPPGHILERHPGQAGPVRDRDAGRSRCRTVSSARPFRPEPFSWRYDYESLSRSIRIRGARSVE